MATLYLSVLNNCGTYEDTVFCTLPPPRQLVAENRWVEDENIRPAPLSVENNPGACFTPHLASWLPRMGASPQTPWLRRAARDYAFLAGRQ